MMIALCSMMALLYKALFTDVLGLRQTEGVWVRRFQDGFKRRDRGHHRDGCRLELDGELGARRASDLSTGFVP
ncbi:hypothetical protein CASFOL_019056 [Castilleja foliolosa]|uniref:Secreted protein n=1 Tax=Castilleja foliolosa TaxID=1961234 RepID=A0ABD3D4W9_9LAMI